MSLLEDVFLQDEADEAQNLERIIEGDGFEDQDPRDDDDDDDDDDGERREDEAEEDKRKVDPNTQKTKKIVKNPRFVLNPARLTGPRGIQVIPEHFKDFKFKGKGHEKEDLDIVLKKLEHWAYRLYPKFKFEDCLKKIEMLGKKRAVMVNLSKIRSDQFMSEETVVQKDSSDDEAPAPAPRDEEEDEFDKLLQQQIDLARTTPQNKSTPEGPRRPTSAGDIGTPMTMPKATSSPSISEEQKQRMLQNRLKAEQRRLARLNQANQENVNIDKVNRSSNDNNHTEIKANEADINQPKHTNSEMDVDTENVLSFSENISGNNKNQKEASLDLTENDKVTKLNQDTNIALFNANQAQKTASVYLTDADDVILTKKHNKSNIIDSSDDDIDYEMEENNSKVDHFGTKQHKKGFNEESVDVNENSGDSLDKTISKAKTSRKANIIDSSDEESNVTAENIATTVDIHGERTLHVKDKAKERSDEKPSNASNDLETIEQEQEIENK